MGERGVSGESSEHADWLSDWSIFASLEQNFRAKEEEPCCRSGPFTRTFFFFLSNYKIEGHHEDTCCFILKIVKVILYSYLILKKMNERITDS